MALTITDRDDLIRALAALGPMEAAVQGAFDGLFSSIPAPTKPEILALTPVSTANATDLATAQALANANKVAINAIIAALKA